MVAIIERWMVPQTMYAKKLIYFKLILRRTVVKCCQKYCQKCSSVCSRSNVKYFDLVTYVMVVNLYFKTPGGWDWELYHQTVNMLQFLND